MGHRPLPGRAKAPRLNLFEVRVVAIRREFQIFAKREIAKDAVYPQKVGTPRSVPSHPK